MPVCRGVAMLLGLSTLMFADTTIYQSGLTDENYIPFAPDSTPGRPSPGNLMGNQITFGGTDRFLDSIQVLIGQGALSTLPDTFTVTLYDNDAVGGSPGTILAASSLFATISPQHSTLDFPFAVEVPDMLTVVVSEAHPTVTLGLASTKQPPLIGSAENGLWFNTNAQGTAWTFNTTWAIADGATTNVFAMQSFATPEPASMGRVAGLGCLLLLLLAEHKRSRRSKSS